MMLATSILLMILLFDCEAVQLRKKNFMLRDSEDVADDDHSSLEVAPSRKMSYSTDFSRKLFLSTIDAYNKDIGSETATKNDFHFQINVGNIEATQASDINNAFKAIDPMIIIFSNVVTDGRQDSVQNKYDCACVLRRMYHKRNNDIEQRSQLVGRNQTGGRPSFVDWTQQMRPKLRRKRSEYRPASCTCTCETKVVKSSGQTAVQHDNYPDHDLDKHDYSSFYNKSDDDVHWNDLPVENCYRRSCKTNANCCRDSSKCDKSSKTCRDCWNGQTCRKDIDCCAKYPICQLEHGISFEGKCVGN
ncbi:hypothetical protein HELRODRAFT_190444 [Helobdella robusta]|uniref:Granulins domain-containing protein n=1 Tax=Helobdella robusta TaxID=6412 RepID=T1FS00_HELRO|nr:hypothetical protein HELRODRAFT_190444 [Helobdella robusta]ESO09281.1 hypothetical protein HELRODRAFT_190444 [Helobdella robusta]